MLSTDIHLYEFKTHHALKCLNFVHHILILYVRPRLGLPDFMQTIMIERKNNAAFIAIK